MEPKGLEELLGEEPAVETPTVEAAPEPEATPEPVAAEEVDDGQPRGPDGKFLSKQTGDEPQATAEATPANPIPDDQFKGYLTEKRKRQELEQQVAELNARFEAAQRQMPQAQPEAPVDFWDNPTGTIKSEVQQAVAAALQAEKQQQTMARINESEVKAKATYADYDDAFRAFQQAATANHSLIQQMTAASDPAEFAYKKGKTALDLERVGSIDELLANAKAQWEQEARAAMPVPTAALPSTTATDGSVGGRTGPAWAGPVPLDQLLG
jgi:hypothetical protein